MAMQIQIQVLLAVGGVEVGVVIPWSNTESNIEVAKLQAFDGVVGKVLEFIVVCKLFLRIKMRKVAVEEQI